MKTLVVMPTFNEAKSLANTVNDLLREEISIDVLIVDDNSQDGTAKIADQLSVQNPMVKIMHRKSKQGLGPAYLDGFRHAISNGYQIVVEMDADGSHRPKDLNKILSAVKQADLVIGSRWIAEGKVQNWSPFRMLLSKFGNVYARVMLGTKIRDMTSGFRAYRADFLEQLIATPVSSQGYSFQVELAYRASKVGIVHEVPITFVERSEGRSKMTLRIVLEALVKIQVWGIKRKLG